MTSSSSSSSGQRPNDSPGDAVVLGVDGGGTKTEAWIAQCDASGRSVVLGRGKAGSSNPRAVGLAPALANLQAAVAAAWGDAGLQLQPTDCAALAISGAGQPEMRERFTEFARAEGLAHRVVMAHDAEAVLAELPRPLDAGVALIVGTGSAAIGAAGDERCVVGGWGYWYGDEGSGYWLGREALAAVARAADGRGPATALTQAFTNRLKAEPRGLLAALEQLGDVRRAIAALAEPVLETAGGGDGVASGIANRAAALLAEMVAGAARGAFKQSEFPLALAGGVACGSQLLCERLVAELAAKGLRPDPIVTVPHPVTGCLRLACEALRN